MVWKNGRYVQPIVKISGMRVFLLLSQTTAWRLCPGVLSSLTSHTTSGQRTADRRTHHTQARRLLDAGLLSRVLYKRRWACSMTLRAIVQRFLSILT
jgi:hypothetical protein